VIENKNSEYKSVKLSTTVACGLIITGVLTGCSKKTDVNAELENAAKELQASPIASPVPSSQPIQAAQPVTPSESQPALAPAQEMNQAMASYKSGNLEDAVTRLQKLRAQTAMTPQQLIAIQNATAAVMGEVYALAAKGDARAKQAVQQYERMQTGR
jgi:hypothetical protein